jgi:hypothetical protein
VTCEDGFCSVRPAIGRVFAEAAVNLILVIVVHVIADQPAETWFVQRNHLVEDLSTGNFPRIFPQFHFARAIGCSSASVSDPSNSET